MKKIEELDNLIRAIAEELHNKEIIKGHLLNGNDLDFKFYKAQKIIEEIKGES